MTYSFIRGATHASIVAASERSAWTAEAVIGNRRFDTRRGIVPTGWVGTEALAFLDAHEQLVLHHCRAFSYVHLLGNFEEMLPPQLADAICEDAHTDRARLRTLLRFADEEVKHQQLFRRAEHVLEASCGHVFGRWFDERRVRVTDLTAAMFAYSALPRFLLVLALERGTQRHYVEPIHARTEGRYADILKAHWIEEAQHTRADVLEVARLATRMSPGELADAFEDVVALGELFDGVFRGQAEEEVATLERVTGRGFTDADRAALCDTLHRSLRGIIAGVGLGHPRF